MRTRILVALFALHLLVPPPAFLHGQERGAAALGQLVAGLGTTARVLVIAAHPDDEDTGLITFLSRGRYADVAYLSLTRGDGGQNLIGNELGELLGVVRTEELLAARRIDGGRQYFTRAYDFGFSKSAEETFRHWPRDSILRDVVTVVRAFRPHVIVSVFSGTQRDGHGQHQVAGLLAREAYDVSMDSVRFPRASTADHSPWTVSKFYRGARFSRESATLAINVGEYSPLLGRSYAEIAAESRSQHKSQGFGTIQRKGPVFTYVRREATRVNDQSDAKAERSVLDGLEPAWPALRREAGGRAYAVDSLRASFAAARASYDPFHFERARIALGRATHWHSVWCERVASGRDGELGAVCATTGERLERALALAAGLAADVTASREVVPPGQAVPLTVGVVNRGASAFDALLVSARGAVRRVMPDSAALLTDTARFSGISEPRWLEHPRTGALFDDRGIGVAERSSDAGIEHALVARLADGTALRFGAPVVARRADPVRGDVQRPLAVAPAVSVSLDNAVQYAPAALVLDREVRVRLRSGSGDTLRASVSLTLPRGLSADSGSRAILLPPDAERTVSFRVRGRLAAGRHRVEAVAEAAGQRYARGYTLVDYDHITPRRVYRDAVLELVALDARLPRNRSIAYIRGVGDNVAASLEQLGLDVTVLEPTVLPATKLSRYAAVVVGPRAYEASDALDAHNAILLDYARKGGTLVVQYGQYEMTRPGIMPYPVTISRPHTRVTMEEAPARLLDERSTLLGYPNRIGSGDFDGWVQERALYMPATFDAAYTPLLEMSDPGEPASRGALLVARYGRGTYVYTTLSFFRQLPAGVPGPARLFLNLVAAGERPVADRERRVTQ